MRLNGCLMQMSVVFFTIIALIGATIFSFNRVVISWDGAFDPTGEALDQQAFSEVMQTPSPTTTDDPLYLTATSIVSTATQQARDITATSVRLTSEWNATDVIRQATEGAVSLTPSETPT